MHDVIIVGGGVAGCYLASRLSGLNVLLIEKNKKVTLKDSGIVSRDFLQFFDERLVQNEITKMEAFSPSGNSFTLGGGEPFAYILKRVEFSQHLRRIANAETVYVNVLGVTFSKDFVTVHTTGGSHSARMVVGCDGANSVVRRYARIQRPFLSLGVMVKTGSMAGDISVFFNKHYSPDFFAWIIPQNNEFGTISSVRPREYLRHFQRKECLPGGQAIAYLIPTGYVKSFANRTLLIGDACGQNKPLTGGGIMFSLRAACHAASVIEQAVERGRFDEKMLGLYEKEWKHDFAREIDKQFLVRMLYRNLTNRDIDRIFREIGPDMQRLRNFDYDKFSGAWVKLPKFKLMKVALRTAMNMI